MKVIASFVIALASGLNVEATPKPSVPQGLSTFQKRTVSQDLYENLVWYWKYATGARLDSCPKPNGKTLVLQIDEASTDTQGYIARDEERKEIIVSFRGTTSDRDNETDFDSSLVPFMSPGVNAPNGTLVHQGFLTAWNSTAEFVIRTFKDQLSEFQDFTLVTTGHSLGGALSSLAGISLKQNFPSHPLRLYSYGQPRTGNDEYAKFVNEAVGIENIYRSVHTDDLVPALPPTSFDYMHHATEYWQFEDSDASLPSFNLTTVKTCDGSGEDPTCSDSIPLSERSVDPGHFYYYGIWSNQTFCS